MEEARLLANYIAGVKPASMFYEDFKEKHSKGFDPVQHLQRVGVVNQTTMLATETQAIADYLRQVMLEKYGAENLLRHFADTRDTLCYATNDNQEATYKLLETDADLAIVVGGYNSSNTSHIVELCERRFPTYFINSDLEIKSKMEIHHFDYHRKESKRTSPYLPEKDPLRIILTSGASCPDTVVDSVMLKILGFFQHAKKLEDVLEEVGV